MQFSGILVVTAPADVAAVAARLDAIPGVEVYARHPDSGRIVVVQEDADPAVHESRLRAMQALPGVLAADLVYHVLDPGPGADEPGAPGADEPAQGATR